MQRSHSVAAPQVRPPAVYYHNGIGGRGNYHKYNRDKGSENHRSVFSRSIAGVFGGGGGSGSSGSGSGGAFHHTSDNPSLVKSDKFELGQLDKSHSPSRWLNIMSCFGARRAGNHHLPARNNSSTTLTSENRT